MIRLDGIRIEVSDFMADSSTAVLIDGVLKVSPAMWSLMEGATPEELNHLFENLKVLNLDNISKMTRDLSDRGLRCSLTVNPRF